MSCACKKARRGHGTPTEQYIICLRVCAHNCSNADWTDMVLPLETWMLLDCKLNAAWMPHESRLTTCHLDSAWLPRECGWMLRTWTCWVTVTLLELHANATRNLLVCHSLVAWIPPGMLLKCPIDATCMLLVECCLDVAWGVTFGLNVMCMLSDCYSVLSECNLNAACTWSSSSPSSSRSPS